jgi:hypothetical protein
VRRRRLAVDGEPDNLLGAGQEFDDLDVFSVTDVDPVDLLIGNNESFFLSGSVRPFPAYA